MESKYHENVFYSASFTFHGPVSTSKKRIKFLSSYKDYS